MREYIFSHYNIFINLDKSFTIEYNFITPTYIMNDWRSGLPDKDIVEHKVIEDYSSSKDLQKTKIVFAKQLGYTKDGNAIQERYSKSGITKNLDEIRQVILKICL